MSNQLKRNSLLKQLLTESFQEAFSQALHPESYAQECLLYPDQFWDATLDTSWIDSKKREVWVTYRIKLHTVVTDLNLESVIREFNSTPVMHDDSVPDTATFRSSTWHVLWINDFQSEFFTATDIKKILSRAYVVFPEDLEKGRQCYERMLKAEEQETS